MSGLIKIIRKCDPEIDEFHAEVLAKSTNKPLSIQRLWYRYKKKLISNYLRNLKKRGGKCKR